MLDTNELVAGFWATTGADSAATEKRGGKVGEKKRMKRNVISHVAVCT